MGRRRHPVAGLTTGRRRRPQPLPATARHGLARVLSRLGVCSRSEAERRVRADRVTVNGKRVHDPEAPVDPARDRIELDGHALHVPARTYVALHKPRGLVVSAHDERGRDTVYALLADSGLPWLAPVGRLDRASEGLLLLSNDPAWAAGITDPATHVAKTYRVQVRGAVTPPMLERLRAGIVDRGERLTLRSVQRIGGGARNSWLEVVLTEGRNRQIRRMLEACGCEVLRLLRVGIGNLVLGELPKGGWRHLDAAEVAALAEPAADPVAPPGLAALKRPAFRPRSMSRSRAGRRPPR